MSDFGVCEVGTRGTRPVVTRADDRILVSPQLVDGANSIHAGHLTLDGNLLGICDVTYELVAWSGEHRAHIARKVKPARPKARPQRGGPAR